MAIFGFHVILTLLSASVFGKIQGRLSLCDIFVFKGFVNFFENFYRNFIKKILVCIIIYLKEHCFRDWSSTNEYNNRRGIIKEEMVKGVE